MASTRITDKEKLRIILLADFMRFVRYFFKETTGRKFQVAAHHQVIADTLTRVVSGDIKRLIINIPPRYGKTEMAVKLFVAWCLANNPAAKFIHLSYSDDLALDNSSAIRDIIKHEKFQDLFPIALKPDSDSKKKWFNTAGGGVYATAAGGAITGFGAGCIERIRDIPELPANGFGGCFPYDQMVETEHGPMAIGDIVNAGMPVRVWSFNEKTGACELKPVIRFWENPKNHIIEVRMQDGTSFRCTPDHEVLTENGWISAIHLSNSLDLMDGQPSSGSGFIPSQCSIDGDFYDAFSVLWLCVPIRIREVLSNAYPCLSEFDLSNDADSNSITSRKLCWAFSTLENGYSIFSSKLCTWPSFQDRESSMPESILHVVGLCAIREIGRRVIGGIPIQMPNLIFKGSWAYELLCHQMGDISESNFTIYGKADPEITMPVGTRLKRSQWSSSADIPKIGNIIKAHGFRDSLPLNVRYVGHVEETFCLEVEGNHNFILSESGAIVSNCIIIDDPIKPDDAFSDTLRNRINRRYNNTIASRVNSPDTPIILIMQRLHEQDMTGFLLDGGSDEEWHHLCLSAVTEDDEALWPEKHDREKLASMERADPYTFAGQYRQRPSPLGGGIIKGEWLVRYTELPKIKWRKVFADTAQKTGERNDYSVFQCWGIGDDNRIYLLDQIRGKWEAPELKIQAVEFWKKHNAPEMIYRFGTLRQMAVEDKASGTGLIQEIRRDGGIPILSIERTKDKLTRVMDVVSHIASGSVCVPANSAYTKDLVAECEAFTADDTHMHDDQIDPMADAINDMLGSSINIWEKLAQ